jgi:hypothetical protein
MDLSVDSLMNHPNLIWIDHHATAISKYGGTGLHDKIPGYRIDGVAACRLAYQWFVRQCGPTKDLSSGSVPLPLPSKEDYVERRVSEPWAVRLAGEYDIWDKRDPDAELFQHGLRSEELYSTAWDDMLKLGGSGTVTRLLNQGRALQYARTRENESVIKAFGFTIQFEGFCLLACNAARYSSQLFAAGLKPEHDGCLGFNWDGQAKVWRISLYTDKPGIDLSPVAVKYGGGGHRGACGFRVAKLPFLP